MDLKQLQHHWDIFGKTDALWAICTMPGKKGNRWDPEAFFATGRLEIERVLACVANLGLCPLRRRALDFGSGVGRLTQALAEHFQHVDGVDVAASMIEQARTLNRYADRIGYHVNETESLSGFVDGSFDFIYTNLVLQHMEPRYSLAYISEFVRLLAPNGVLVFQLVSHRIGRPVRQTLRLAFPRFYRAFRWAIHRGGPIMEMHCVPRNQMLRHLERLNTRVVHATEDSGGGRFYASYLYFVTRY